jgi:probable F420-dependent oxidoreductase
MFDGLGSYGVWRHGDKLTPELAAGLERLGYGTIWIGGSPDGDLNLVDELLDATSTITVATGIVNIWKDEPQPVAESYHRIEAAHPGRFLLGIGAGHREATAEYVKPYAALVHYLDELDKAEVPAERRVLAALGPKVLQLSADRAAGAHPYLTTPAHTRQAREILGSAKLLAPEQKVVIEADPARARALGRPPVATPYLKLVNYLNNLRSLGYSEADLADGGSDKLIDDLVVHGDDAALAAGINAHLDAGANHVALQLLPADDTNPLAGFAILARALFGRAG